MTINLSIDELQALWNKVTRLHSGQTYGGQTADEKIEYINHIGSVVFEVMNAADKTGNGFDAALAVKCAMLHDTIEDTGITAENIREEFGDAVTGGVVALTKNMSLAKDSRMIDSLERIKQQPKEIWAVKLADRISNLNAPPHYWNNEKKESYRQEAKVILRHLQGGNAYLESRLAQKIEEYKMYID